MKPTCRNPVHCAHGPDIVGPRSRQSHLTSAAQARVRAIVTPRTGHYRVFSFRVILALRDRTSRPSRDSAQNRIASLRPSVPLQASQKTEAFGRVIILGHLIGKFLECFRSDRSCL
jgi:hypothetical protein